MRVGDLIRLNFNSDSVVGVLMKIRRPRSPRMDGIKLCVEILENDGTKSSWKLWSEEVLEVISEAG